MVVRKSRKIHKQRGHRKTGWGKEHRGSGQKGGAGASASGKGAQAKKPSYRDKIWGRHGFASRFHSKGMNLGVLDSMLEKLTAEKKIKKIEKGYEIVLKNIKITKILGRGQTNHKLHIIGKVSKKAKEKIEKAGGTIA